MGDAGRGRGRLEASELGGRGTEPRLGVAPGVRGQGSWVRVQMRFGQVVQTLLFSW